MSGARRLRHRVIREVVQRSLWGHGDRVAVAVSGGLDSVVLLDVLACTVAWHGARLSVVTIDHGTRPDSASDADFVEELSAGRYGLPVYRVALNLGVSASEATCREARYRALAALPVDRVALAHHRDDQAETLILELLRGAGPGGLAGMPWRRGPYVRPLLDERREDLARWASEADLSWREDPTNRSPRFLRNRVRHELLPQLEALRPGAATTIARAAAILAEDEELLRALAAPLGGGPVWSTAVLVAAAAPLARRALLSGIPGASAGQIDAILAAVHQGGGEIALAGGAAVFIDDEEVRLVVPADPIG